MKSWMRLRFVLTIATVMLASGSALAAEPAQPAAADPSPEMRHKMAEVHQKMAECLLSEKPIAECRSEMQTSCQATMGKGGCPMMGGGMGAGMMMHEKGTGMMQGAPSQAPPSGSQGEKQ